jgi:hypothetical protein
MPLDAIAPVQDVMPTGAGPPAGVTLREACHPAHMAIKVVHARYDYGL